MLYDAYVKKEKVRSAEQIVDSYKPIPWPQVVADLGEAGYSPRKIAEILNIAYATVEGWKKNATPNYDYGCKLLEIHAELTGKRI